METAQRSVDSQTPGGPAATGSRWRNRIVGTGSEPPERLVANPLNWRIHPPRQHAALAGALASVGWVQQVVVNRRTGFVVDGHLRVALCDTTRTPGPATDGAGGCPTTIGPTGARPGR
jgi:hypothetical protein